MATFRTSIDLMSIPGAKALTLNDGTAENPRNVNYICIPADLNEVTINRSRSDDGKLTAYLSLMMRPLNQSYINSIVENKQRRGDAVDMSKIESHELTLNHTPEFMKAWTDAVAAKLLKEHPEWAGQNHHERVDNGANDLYYEVRRVINKRVGKGYPMISQQQTVQTAPATNFGAPAGVAQFVPPTQSSSSGFGPNASQPQNLTTSQPQKLTSVPGEAPIDDLPF